MKYMRQPKTSKILMFVLLVTLFSILSFEAEAAQIQGVNFDEVYKDEGVVMELQGTGLKTMLFFKAFVAGFYQDETYPGEDLGQFPKRIEVEYFVDIPAKKLNNYTVERMKVNTTDTEFQSIIDKVELMADYFVDLKSGDRFSLTYIPGLGTKFAHNGQLVGIIEGEDFAKALFAVWIGQEPFDEKLKEQILGDRHSPANKIALN
ncbi:MAG: chalcone isomerase family protein [Candidatus Omnitrophica bacterium]|nr:chalcone isomerase family protein [Candidatus Omnitrophota bacterium]